MYTIELPTQDCAIDARGRPEVTFHVTGVYPTTSRYALTGSLPEALHHAANSMGSMRRSANSIFAMIDGARRSLAASCRWVRLASCRHWYNMGRAAMLDIAILGFERTGVVAVQEGCRSCPRPLLVTVC